MEGVGLRDVATGGHAGRHVRREPCDVDPPRVRARLHDLHAAGDAVAEGVRLGRRIGDHVDGRPEMPAAVGGRVHPDLARHEVVVLEVDERVVGRLARWDVRVDPLPVHERRAVRGVAGVGEALSALRPRGSLVERLEYLGLQRLRGGLDDVKVRLVHGTRAVDVHGCVADAVDLGHPAGAPLGAAVERSGEVEVGARPRDVQLAVRARRDRRFAPATLRPHLRERGLERGGLAGQSHADGRDQQCECTGHADKGDPDGTVAHEVSSQGPVGLPTCASPPSDASRSRQKNGAFKSIEDLRKARASMSIAN